MQSDPLPWAEVEIIENNLFLWQCLLQGPENTPFKKGWFTMHLKIPSEYPFKHPEIQFQTKVFHPNVDKDGNICQLVLGENWSPQIKLREVLLIIRHMLEEPSLESPLDEEAAALFRNNRTDYDKRVKQYVKQYAIRR